MIVLFEASLALKAPPANRPQNRRRTGERREILL